jgi:hypothetical protein
MTRVYVILSIIGWAWCVFAGVFLFVNRHKLGSSESDHEQ